MNKETFGMIFTTVLFTTMICLQVWIFYKIFKEEK